MGHAALPNPHAFTKSPAFHFPPTSRCRLLGKNKPSWNLLASSPLNEKLIKLLLRNPQSQEQSVTNVGHAEDLFLGPVGGSNIVTGGVAINQIIRIKTGQGVALFAFDLKRSTSVVGLLAEEAAATPSAGRRS